MVLAHVEALGDEVHEVIEVFDHVLGWCVVGEVVQLGAVLFSVVRVRMVTGVCQLIRCDFTEGVSFNLVMWCGWCEKVADGSGLQVLWVL